MSHSSLDYRPALCSLSSAADMTALEELLSQLETLSHNPDVSFPRGPSFACRTKHVQHRVAQGASLEEQRESQSEGEKAEERLGDALG